MLSESEILSFFISDVNQEVQLGSVQDFPF